MRILKKMLLFIILVITTFTLINKTSKNLYYYIYSSATSARKISNIGVLFFNFQDPYMSLVKQSLERKNENNNVKFTFFDGKDNSAIRDEALNTMFTNNFDLLLIDLVNEDENEVVTVVSEAQQKNIPIIIFNFEFDTIPEVVKSYNKVIFIATDSRKSGVLQGKLIVDKWLANKEILDKNKDDKIQYIMLKGSPGSKATDNRTKYSILTINNSGIITEELSSKTCNWERELSKTNVESLFLKYGNNIEMIIANNDAMAIGAIEALQKYGFNKGDTTKYIPVFGIDGILEAKDLINKGMMAGTVIQDPNELAQALYTVGMNLISNIDPLESTNYSFDKTGKIIEISYYEYKE